MAKETNNGAEGSIAPDERKRALVTGITGQDGAYLTELLLSKGALGAAAAVWCSVLLASIICCC